MFRDPVQSLEAPSFQPTAEALRPLRVGMIGIGTVGAGTFRVLARNQALIAGRAGRGIEVVVVAARNLARAVSVVGKDVALTNDPLQVATHPDVDVLVEAAGGTGPAREWVLAAIRAGKHVVTANKALLAEHGNEIFAAARQHGVAVAYEGAVAVSIPIVKALREGLTANRIEWVAGIINGTTNFILSKMRDEGVGFAQALAQAQALGYAEADPTFDIEGIDAAHKITLLAANAFGMPLRFADAQVEGITALQGLDVVCAEQLGFRIKLLGVARRREHGDGVNGDGADGVELRVQPALIPATHLLAHVNGSMNGIMVKGDASGVTMYYGAGAGSEQTASAVIADLVDVARLHGTHAAQRVPHLGFHAPAIHDHLAVLPRAAVHTRHYLRVPVHQAQQVEAVGAWLAAQHVPVAKVQLACAQHLPAGGTPQVLVLTDAVAQATVDLAVHALGAHPAVAGPVVSLRVEMLEG
ncbi:homoserine dehydrogenase [Acidovorax sp. Leaf76]|uniref:homoserine dehydrogenase n=1 Tax=unclassified Acidovorax TaxID=2684926 RepID=UPI0006F6FB67|nr:MULTISPECIES: homoserine dehydrogenase [unclassified Acidovorax]KQO27060.1 homoserine dehydrogenase [Acidovorax sp. Leaf76]KQO40807.1 homoserine dehydrogenase [Acidovorax sp. Leaf84]KQS42950.1 homoserine dehydrogenase [Acidovorax sp. Leaf191]